ncbi:reverse transcriptase domain-containing protein [Tanacetum coccineum]
MAMYHAFMKSMLADEDAIDQGVADKQKKRKPDNEDRDEDPPARPDQGLKIRKTSKDVEPSKRSKSNGSSKGNTSSQPKPKSIGKSIHAEETVYEVEAMETPQNQGDDMVTNVKINKWYGYGHLEEIKVRREDQQLYKFMKGDFQRLHLNDIEDMLLLVVQNKLFNLKGDVIVDLAVELHQSDTKCIHSDDGNPSRANIKQALRTASAAVKPCQGDSFGFYLITGIPDGGSSWSKTTRTYSRQALSIEEAIWRLQALLRLWLTSFFVDPLALKEEMKALYQVATSAPKMSLMVGLLARPQRASLIHLTPHHAFCTNKGGCLPVRQKKRGQAPERNKAIHKEVEKMVKVGIMKEVHYHSWLSNPVMVKKRNGSWRMCVDFKDLNKACPKDGYPLPKIDWKVESLCGYPFKCFLDAYKGYHLAKEDEEKTSFITSQGIFCYLKMSFELKNVGATFQRLVDKAFQNQIGRNLEVYVDDLFIKIHTEQEVIRDIEETFKTLREINMMLNPKKMHLWDERRHVHGVQSECRRIKTKKSLPFFKTMKKCTKKSDFQWTVEVEMAFKQMKKLIAKLHVLTTPKEKEELIIYLAAAKEISAVLMMEKDGKQIPIYFVSRALQGPEINYTPMKKLILALILSNPEVIGRLLKWSFELGEHDIYYRPRTSVKGQILADFIMKHSEDDPLDTPMEEKEELFDTTNNESEYEALIAGLQIAEQMGIKNLQANVGSRLVANQVNKTYIAKEPGMIKYLEKKFFQRKRGRQEPYTARQVNYVLREIHKRSCSMHAGPRSVVVKSLRLGYYWPTMYADARKLIRECNSCQVHHSVPRNLQQNLTPITSPWPFYKWGIDIAGPFPIKFARGNNPFIDWCEKLCIRQCFASVTHPQANGLVERENRRLGEGIKACNGETLFLLTYGTKAVILVEIGMPTLRTVKVDMIKNDEALEINLDLLEERREQAAIQEAKSKAKMEKYYNARVRNTSFKPGDLVYQNNEASHAEDGGKLGPKWEGPYEVTKALGKGAYKLRDCHGNILP